MTTWESIDNVDMENITITNDAAFERVTSDEHFEDERDWSFLKQNTSWLVQEVPNISFLDIADTMLENKKTLYNRENWIIRVGKAGRSIEAQPQDIVTFSINEDYTVSSWEHYIEFDSSMSSQNYTVCKPWQQGNVYTIEILETWRYIISYWYQLDTHSSTDITISVGLYTGTPIVTTINEDRYKGNLMEMLSWWKYIPNILLNKGEKICMRINTDDQVTIWEWTYLNIQFQQYNVWLQ